ncbi:hypothetical protein [Urechidicola sp. KH5]
MILVNFENSEDYHSNGFKKRYISYTDEGFRKIEYLNADGRPLRYDIFDGNELKYSQLNGTDSNNFSTYKLDLRDREGHFYSFSKTNGSVTVIKLFNNRPNTIVYKTGSLKADYTLALSDSPIINDRPDEVKIYYDNEFRQYYKYDKENSKSSRVAEMKVFNYFKSWKPYENGYCVYYESRHIDYDYIQEVKIISFHDNGMVKELYEEDHLNIGYDIHAFFNDEGWPIKQKMYSKNKLKVVQSFDSKTKDWTELKKRDW